jgi:2-methylisocitrate lyase-like PEP mutase family enzyme
MSEQRERAERLRELHRAPPALVLPNAWDVASAVVFAALPGCRAIATSSAGVAAALGYPDGEAIPREVMLDAVARIATAVELPVTADLEAGYGPRPEDAAATAEGAVEAGAVGLNLEDGTGQDGGRLLPVSDHAEKIQAVRAVGDRRGVPLVVNARVDVYLRGIGDPAGRLEETLARAAAYRNAGADCIFVPGVEDAATIAALVRGIDAPVNVLAVATTPSVPELERLGVARVSVASGLFRASLAFAARAASDLLESGSFAFAADALPYADLDRLFRGESTQQTT